IALLVAVERVGEVVGAVDEQHWHLRLAEIFRRLEILDPGLAPIVRHLAEGRHPDAVLVEEAATVDGDGDLEATVHTGDDACQIAAPANAGNADPIRIDVRNRPEQAVASYDGG